MRNLKTIILFWVAILACLNANAQSANLQVIGSSGGTFSIPGGYKLTSTVGELVISTIGTDPRITQGFNQSLLSFTVTNVTSADLNKSYKEGDVLNINVSFSQTVYVLGAPELALNSGGKATYTSGSASSILTFTYTVGAGENSTDLDYASINALTLAGGSSIKNDLYGDASLILAVPGAATSLGANKNIIIDSTAPGAPTTLALNPASDSGFSNSDGITNVTTPVITGTAEDGSTVTVFDTDGTTVLGVGVSTGGVWSITTSTLSDGVHNLTAKATDLAGNISIASDALSISVLTTTPQISIASNVPDLKIAETATITFTLSENSGSTFNWDGSIGSIMVTGGTLSAITGDGSGKIFTAIFTPTAGINNGIASITVPAGSYTDPAGNPGGAGISPVLSFDTLIPDAPSKPVLAAISDSGISNSDRITNVNTPLFAGTAQAGTVIVLYDTDGSTVLGTDVAIDGIWSITTSSLAEGVHSITSKATDPAGNISLASAAVSVTIDFTSPTVLISSNVAQLKSGQTATITFSFSKDPANTFVWDGAIGDIQVSGGTLSAVSGAGLIRTATFSPNANTDNGIASITIAASTYTDVAGNNGSAGTSPELTFDTLLPIPPGTPVLAAISDSGVSSTDQITNVTTPLFNGLAEINSTVILYDTDGTTVLGTGVAAGGIWTITSSTLTAGVHTITAKSIDAAGNISLASDGLLVTIDHTSPLLAIASSSPRLKAGETAIITFTFSKDPVGTFGWDGTSGDVLVSGGTLSAISGTGILRTAVFTPTANTNSGSATVTVLANSYTDIAGNFGAAASSPLINFDTSAPAIPANIVALPADKEVLLQWTANTESDLASYLVYGGTSPAPTTLIATVPTGSSSFMQSMLVNGTTYYYRIQAVDQFGNLSGITTDASAVPTANQTITFNAIGTKTYGDGTFLIGNANSSANLPITYIADDPSIVSITGNSATILKAGTAIIRASQPGNVSVNPAPDVEQTLSVSLKELTITAANLNKTYGDTFSFTGTEFTATGLINGDAITTITLNSNGTLPTANVGGSAYDLIPSNALGNGLANYNLVYVNGKLSVNKKGLLITANPQVKYIGAAVPLLTVSYIGLVNGETNAVLSNPPIISTIANNNSPAGEYDINVSGATADNYLISYQKGILTVRPDVPTSISLANVSLFENAPAGTNAGTLSSTSDNPDAVFSYSLVTGSGDADNSSFAINGNKLLTTVALNFENKSTYKIRVRTTTQNNNTLEKEFSITVTDVNEAPTLSAIGNQVLCFTSAIQKLELAGISAGPESGQLIKLSVSSNNSNLFESLNVNGSGATGILSYKLKIGASGSATITVTVKDDGGTDNGGVDTYEVSFVVQVNGLPTLVIHSDKGDQVSKGATVVLTAGGGTNYVWSNSNGVIGGLTSATLTVRPRETTTYTVSATNASGCTSIQTFTLKVLDDLALIKATNIVSPNGDGYNDKWIIDNIDFYPNNEVKIFDKSGRMLYQKKGYDNSWDATLNGSALQEGTYFYIIDFGTKTPKFRGFITVIREN